LEYAKKSEKICTAFICLPIRRKTFRATPAPSSDSNVRPTTTLPSVSKFDQKMNGHGFFRSEYATGGTGNDAHLTPRSGS
jgi:hypothetical protein